MSNIKLLRLLSGEEIIGDVSDLDGNYHVQDPAVLRWVPSENDPKVPKLIMASLIPHAEEDDVIIQARHVIFSITPIEELMNEYNAIYGSGIVTPPKNDLIT